MGKGRSWTQEEIDFLQDKWGVISIKAIAKNLDRSINAVKLKAQRTGLSDARFAFDGITVSQLAEALGISYSILKNWIKLYDFPAKKRIFAAENRVLVVTYDDFWEWAEQNKQMLDFTRLEPLLLGPEPDWVKEKRTTDTRNGWIIKKSHNNAWSKQEDTLLKSMLKAYKYTYPEISKKLNRSEGAVKRRILDLGLKMRPISLNNHVKYTSEEVEMLIELYEKGYCLEYIAEKMNKSALGIRGKLERMGYKFKNGVPVVDLKEA